MKNQDKEKKTEEAGSWRIVSPIDSDPHPQFVKYSETGQYNLLTTSEYTTEIRAALALALYTRPTQLTHMERVQLHTILEEK